MDWCDTQRTLITKKAQRERRLKNISRAFKAIMRAKCGQILLK